MRLSFKTGLKDGIPICMGYFAVSFGVGILAVKAGLTAWIAAIISVSNLTSAGEAAGIGVIGAGGTLIEMALTQLLINCRYSLMGVALSQKLCDNYGMFHRITTAFGITDEIFGMAISKEEKITPSYMYGVILIATIGWTSGTFLGAICGEVLPKVLVGAMGILLYGMFIAVIMPTVHKGRANVQCILLAASISCILYFCFPQVTSGFAVIISAVLTSVLMAITNPVDPEDDE